MIQDDLRRGSVIERLARYHLPLRHRPCNNSRSPEYKVNIYLTAYLHYITTRPSFSLSFPFPFPFLFFPSLRGPIRSTEGDQRHYGVARARARAREAAWLFLFSFVSLSLPAPFPFPVCLRAFMSALHVMINRSAPRRKWISSSSSHIAPGSVLTPARAFVPPRRGDCEPRPPETDHTRGQVSAVRGFFLRAGSPSLAIRDRARLIVSTISGRIASPRDRAGSQRDAEERHALVRELINCLQEGQGAGNSTPAR